MIPTPEQAYALVCDYNEGEFHRKHARIVGDVMRWYANELGYGAEADFWQTVGILHDLDFFDVQTIGYDKINQLRHVRYLKDRSHTLALMQRRTCG